MKSKHLLNCFALSLMCILFNAKSAPNEEPTTQIPSKSYRLVETKRVQIISACNFETVRENIEKNLPELGNGTIELLKKSNQRRNVSATINLPELSILSKRDFGALLADEGPQSKLIQYEIGNPITATSMTQYQPGAALYAPIRVVLYTNGRGYGIIEYDMPSFLFQETGDERVIETARQLDKAIDNVIAHATSCPD